MNFLTCSWLPWCDQNFQLKAKLEEEQRLYAMEMDEVRGENKAYKQQVIFLLAMLPPEPLEDLTVGIKAQDDELYRRR